MTAVITLGVLIIVLAIAVAVLSVSNAKLWIEVKAMQNSTHTLTYMNPLDQKSTNFETITEEFREKLKQDSLEAII